jgi:pimeloyl-ACP methyl ester carboxylesterase
MARYGLRSREDGRYELKMDPALRGVAPREAPEVEIDREVLSPASQWAALARITCPALVVRGAASDILSPETADKMVDESLRNGRLAIVAQAGHSVMTDNPEGFEEALSGFLLSEE